MKRFQITEAEYEAIKAKEAAAKDKKVSRRLQVLMMRHEGKSLDEITKMLKLHRVSITQICQRYREQGLEEFVRNKHESHYRLLSEEKETAILNRFQSKARNQVTAKEIKKALDAKCGKDTGHMYVYNVLNRHGGKEKCRDPGIQRRRMKRLARPQKNENLRAGCPKQRAKTKRPIDV